MGKNQSKLLRPVPYNCYEVAHTWDPSCTGSAVNLGLDAYEESLKIYTTVYVVGMSECLKWRHETFVKSNISLSSFHKASALLKGRLPNVSELRSMIFNILQSTTFLAFNGFGYVCGVCGLRLSSCKK